MHVDLGDHGLSTGQLSLRHVESTRDRTATTRAVAATNVVQVLTAPADGRAFACRRQAHRPVAPRGTSRHQQTGHRLEGRVGVNNRIELCDDFDVSSDCESGLCPAGDRRELELGQTLSLGDRPTASRMAPRKSKASTSSRTKPARLASATNGDRVTKQAAVQLEELLSELRKAPRGLPTASSQALKAVARPSGRLNGWVAEGDDGGA